jgi:hypothetical protein
MQTLGRAVILLPYLVRRPYVQWITSGTESSFSYIFTLALPLSSAISVRNDIPRKSVLDWVGDGVRGSGGLPF